MQYPYLWPSFQSASLSTIPAAEEILPTGFIRWQNQAEPSLFHFLKYLNDVCQLVRSIGIIKQIHKFSRLVIRRQTGWSLFIYWCWISVFIIYFLIIIMVNIFVFDPLGIIKQSHQCTHPAGAWESREKVRGSSSCLGLDFFLKGKSTHKQTNKQ